LLVALGEAAIGGAYSPSALGARIDLTDYAPGVEPAALLYGEDPGRVVISSDPAHAEAIAALGREHGIPVRRVGRVEGRNLELRVGSRLFSWDVAALRRIYFEAIPRRMRHADAERSAGE
jgi:hypothetical protein